jgi:hypothetical protein
MSTRPIDVELFIWSVLAAFDGSYNEDLQRHAGSSAQGNVVTVRLYDNNGHETDTFELTLRRVETPR